MVSPACRHALDGAPRAARGCGGRARGRDRQVQRAEQRGAGPPRARRPRGAAGPDACSPADATIGVMPPEGPALRRRAGSSSRARSSESRAWAPAWRCRGAAARRPISRTRLTEASRRAEPAAPPASPRRRALADERARIRQTASVEPWRGRPPHTVPKRLATLVQELLTSSVAAPRRCAIRARARHPEHGQPLDRGRVMDSDARGDGGRRGGQERRSAAGQPSARRKELRARRSRGRPGRLRVAYACRERPTIVHRAARVNEGSPILSRARAPRDRGDRVEHRPVRLPGRARSTSPRLRRPAPPPWHRAAERQSGWAGRDRHPAPLGLARRRGL